MGLRGSFFWRVACNLVDWLVSPFRVGCLRLVLDLGFVEGLVVREDRVDRCLAGDWTGLLLWGGAMVSLQMSWAGIFLVLLEGRSCPARSGSKRGGEVVEIT